jgi:hypothetical protein
MRVDIEKYVKSCDACQRYKDFPQKPSGKLQPLETPSEPCVWVLSPVNQIANLTTNDSARTQVRLARPAGLH